MRRLGMVGSTQPLAIVVGALAFAIGIPSSRLLKPRMKSTTIKHILIAKFKDDVERADIEEMVAKYGALVDVISQMGGFEW